MADLQEKIETAVGLQLELRKLLLEIIGQIPGEGGGTIDGSDITDNSITHLKLGDSSVRNRHIGTSSVQTSNIAAQNVTLEKLADDVTTILKGKLTASQGAAVADSAGSTDADTAVNALLASLRAADIIATS
ncbi:hypothetical protein [Bacillus swezeyi]|uniref:hypothetical protein n=1 Tax=Bacillus swezeyi TaxID=1925020 RepID=UPI0027DBF3EA|nr:hypothetical protein [Bacillus swezeyi]